LLPGIDLPDRSAANLRDDIIAAGAGKSSPHVIVFGCRDDAELSAIEKAGHRVVKVNCMGQLPPSYIDFALSRGHADGVMLLGCQDGNCSYRFGAEWTEQRMARQRDPMLRGRVDVSRVALGWQAPWADNANAVQKLHAFVASLKP
jgi:coenzyme F420-reducing hydrogenase delta subunit